VSDGVKFAKVEKPGGPAIEAPGQGIGAVAVDDGGPRLLNADTLDNRRITVEPVSYSGEMSEPPPVPEVIPQWVEKAS
jgi:hypothetical protein